MKEGSGLEEITETSGLDLFSFEDAENIGKEILPSILNRLAFECNVSVGEPYQTGGTLPKDASGSLHTVRKDVLLLWDSASPVLTLGDTTRQELAKLLEQPVTRPDLYTAYRFAGFQNDPVARFMFFYNILLQLHNDSQKQIDDFIRKEMPNIPQSPRPDKPRLIETIYTRLRNEVGHTRTGATSEQTSKEIKENVMGLQTLVKAAISRVVE